jgi:hypothetical protein
MLVAGGGAPGVRLQRLGSFHSSHRFYFPAKDHRAPGFWYAFSRLSRYFLAQTPLNACLGSSSPSAWVLADHENTTPEKNRRNWSRPRAPSRRTTNRESSKICRFCSPARCRRIAPVNNPPPTVAGGRSVSIFTIDRHTVMSLACLSTLVGS